MKMCIDKDINYTNKEQILQLFDFYEGKADFEEAR